MLPLPDSVLAQVAQKYANGNTNPSFNSPESWKHLEQVKAILQSMIGPNGKDLTSKDPYNTTVFVGGLSPLIGEETLRSFFKPFGDIHYVSVIFPRAS